MNRLNWLDWTAFVLLVVGGLNWGLVGVFGFDLVGAVFGVGTASRVVFGLVGLAALYAIYSLTKLGTMATMRPAGREEERIRRAA